MTDTARFQTRLLELRAELQERLGRIREHAAEGVPSDSQEQVTARENDDVIRSLKIHIEQELSAVAAALQRIEAGTFGVCADCGKGIEPERLDALPFTPLCSGCA